MKNIAIAAVMLSAVFAQPALSAGLDAKVAECGDARVLETIPKRFHHAAHNLFDRSFGIESIAKVHQHRLVKATERSPIARRYCGAVAHMSDGKARTMWYLIEDGMGLAGLGDNVEFCISGLDPIKAYGGRCRALK